MGVSEYTLVKQELLKPFPAKLAALESRSEKVYLVPATLRPETMYGQTNCWIAPDGEYIAAKVRLIYANDICSASFLTSPIA